MIHTSTNTLDRTNLATRPTDPDAKKAYSIKCYTKEDWVFIHEELEKDGSLEDNIPDPSIVCPDKKEHSDTRATYMLTDAEAEDLRKHEKVQWVCIDYDVYPGNYHPDPKDIVAGVQRFGRGVGSISNYRAFNTAPTGTRPPTTQAGIGATDKNRTGYQILRHTQKENPWDATFTGLTGSDHIIIEKENFQLGDGTGVDAIVSDDGFWIAHPEFVTTADDPVGWSTGNALTWSGISTTPGTCGVLDVLLDGPYYIDPDWFNADPGNRLTQRWDGTTVPVESVARAWWSDSSQRSAGFSTIGTTNGFSSFYSRQSCNGSNTQKPTNGSDHGTQCAGQVYGKNYGSAYNCNKWVLNGIGGSNAGINGSQFDIQKLFHLYKPNYDRHSAITGRQNDTKNPTLSSNSWGYRANTIHNGGYYWYRPSAIDGSETGTSYSSSSAPEFIDLLGAYGDGNRMKGEMVDSSVTAAGDELSEAGVIFVCAAGNSNQTQCSPGDLDFDNYWATSSQGDSRSLATATHSEFGLTCYNTINRRGWPQSLGKTTSGLSTAGTEYAAINIGALDDQYISSGLGGNTTDYKEKKVSYSDMGTGIDCYGAADDTLTADGRASSLTYVHPETYVGLGLTPYDVDFGGTSSGCPTCAGWITTKLQYNRGWTWRDVKSWLNNQCGTQDPDRFYYGDDITSFTATTAAWEDMYSHMAYGQGPVIIWDAPTGSPNEPKKPEIRITNSPNLKISGGVEIKFS
ncbi:hypothetical protein SSSM7_232 [Synechococcus phage S-SSM7]|uniref:Peptidase S8/S53 domain-containing protein n=1 Tax=Synechococcus phage S-SSM7 TaxID=445686 RepID=E3SLE9_9CAUD|nr:hypothetical protein SSSM7_232 [Synechococcus phage S-SSM7]ADO98297.1 hypothetical protein SSSM7_232 [Synechococcus phage S-SSM7]